MSYDWYDSENTTISAVGGSTPKTTFLGPSDALYLSKPAMSTFMSTTIQPANQASINDPLVAAPIQPFWNTGPGGGPPPWAMTNPSSDYNNISEMGSGWFGGDHYTGQGGNPGNYGHVDNSATVQQAAAAAPSDPTPKIQWATDATTYMNEAQSQQSLPDMGNAYQLMYNASTFLVNNVDFSGPAAGVDYAQVVDDTTTSFGLCVGALAADAAFLASPELSLPVELLTAGAMGATLLGVTNDCAKLVQAGVATASAPVSAAVQSLVFGAGNSILSIGRTMPDFTDPGNAIGVGTKAPTSGSILAAKSAAAPPTTPQQMEQYATPGWTPGAAELTALRPYMTAAAQATYFGHS